jgi:hypothetical protein
MSSATDRFLARKRLYDTATDVVLENLRMIWKAVGALSLYEGGADPPWQWVVLVGKGSDQFPSRLEEVGFEIDIDRVPDWIELGRILAAWHRADEKCREAWVNLALHEKQSLRGFSPPPRKQPPMSTRGVEVT